MRVLAVLLAFTAGVLLSPPPVQAQPAPPTTVEEFAAVDDYSGPYNDKRLLVARIQSDLDRVAAGRSRGPLMKGVAREPEEAVVEAYERFLARDLPAMDRILAGIPDLTAERRRQLEEERGSSEYRRAIEVLLQRLERRQAFATHASPLVRLSAVLQGVDALLVAGRVIAAMELGADKPGAFSFYPVTTDLRLPCRTILDRVPEFASAAAAFGPDIAAADLLACPGSSTSFQQLERLVRDPGLLQAVSVKSDPVSSLPVPSWLLLPHTPMQPPERETAVARMGDDPGMAEPILEAAASRDMVGRLDFALFLHALRPESIQRNARISALVADLAAGVPGGARVPDLADPGAYDGSDDSLVSTIAHASMFVARTNSQYYVIPCAVLLARPRLLDATEERYGGGSDAFLPQSGCSQGRGSAGGFPEREVQVFLAATGESFSYFAGPDRAGRLRRSIDMAQVGFRSLLNQIEPALDYPYENRGFVSLFHHDRMTPIKQRYGAAHAALRSYYLNSGLTLDEAAKVAKIVLFAIAPCSACDAAPSQKALRALLMSGANGDEVEAYLVTQQAQDPSYRINWEEDGAHPLLHVSVDNPDGLAALLTRAPDVDIRAASGETALMVAVQRDRIDSVRLLLSRGARPNLGTWTAEDAGTSCATTALMNAAGSASLPVIGALLVAGADPFQADTMGRRAIDYLVGFGSQLPNPKLTPEERARAATLLF